MTALAEDVDARSALVTGLTQMDIQLAVQALDALLGYVDLLQKWNRVYNLTAVRGFEGILRHHLLDSLSVLPWIAGGKLLDVGSGAGLPGIPLAIARPSLSVSLLDTNDKKAAFLQQAAAELVLPNVSVVRERVERFSPVEPYDIVIARAFAELGEFARLARPLVAESGRLVAMKGLYPTEEIKNLPAGIRVAQVERVQIPGLDAARHIVVMTRSDSG